MEKTNLWPCPLDEKNLTTDWIDETFSDGGWMETPQSKNSGFYQYLTFVSEVLVKITWKFGENQLIFQVIHIDKASEDYLEKESDKAIAEIIKLVEYFENTTNEYADNENKIAVRYNQSKDRIDFFFYWNNVG